MTIYMMPKTLEGAQDMRRFAKVLQNGGQEVVILTRGAIHGLDPRGVNIKIHSPKAKQSEFLTKLKGAVAVIFEGGSCFRNGIAKQLKATKAPVRCVAYLVDAKSVKTPHEVEKAKKLADAVLYARQPDVDFVADGERSQSVPPPARSQSPLKFWTGRTKTPEPFTYISLRPPTPKPQPLFSTPTDGAAAAAVTDDATLLVRLKEAIGL